MKNSWIITGPVRLAGTICFWVLAAALCSGCAMMAASIATDAVTSATREVVTVTTEGGSNAAPQKEGVDALMPHIPLDATYAVNYDQVWDAAMVSLRENQEAIGKTDMQKGNIQSGEKEWNQQMASTLETEFGIQAAPAPGTFTKMEKSLQGYLKHNSVRYSYNIQIDRVEKGVCVKAEVVFSGDINASAADSLPVPERCALLRARFFKILNQKIRPILVKLPANPLEDIPYDNSDNKPPSQVGGS